jgi:hypothetical protein
MDQNSRILEVKQKKNVTNIFQVKELHKICIDFSNSFNRVIGFTRQTVGAEQTEQRNLLVPGSKKNFSKTKGQVSLISLLTYVLPSATTCVLLCALLF